MYKIKSNYEIKDVDEKQGILICYPSVFNVIDSDRYTLPNGKQSIGDMVMPGAFAKTLKENGPESPKNRIKHLYQHQRDLIIGKPVVIIEDKKGLYTESQFGQDTFSRDKLQQHIDGLITEMSFGYDVIKDLAVELDNDRWYNQLIELKLWEYSSVTWGANYLTEAYLGVKSLDKIDILNELNKRIEKLCKGLRNPKYTDETLEGFELEIKQIQAIINEILLKQEPVNTTPEPDGESTLVKDLRQILFT